MFSDLLPKTELSTKQNLKWLFILRNLMIASQSVLILISVHGLNIVLPQEQLWLVVLSIASVNLYTWMRLKTDDPVTELEIFSHLVIDVLSIAALLYMTGGASNPIIWVFLLPLIITAIMLPPSYAWYMVILTTSTYTVLITYNIPLPAIEPHIPTTTPELMMIEKMTADSPHSDMDHFEMLRQMHEIGDKHYFNLHIFGMWFGFVFSAGLVAFFVVELAKTLRAQERSLAEARENALRDERVVSLGTLAASAAHDISTPLATIAIVAHELENEYPDHRYPDLHEKAQIMAQQINRCKQALSVMSASAGEMRAESGKIMPLIEYIDEVISQWRTHRPETKLNLFINPVVPTNAGIIAERTLTHSLINILNNAAEATQDDLGIEFHASWDLEQAHIKIRDFGPGVRSEILELIGKQPVISNKSGLGVGLFLTCSTIRRLGGKIEFTNLESGGACVEITLPLLALEEANDITGTG
ncbi:ATP-binding protein [Methylotuvimicrobium alcaliphilum]|uniref:histidine kinase n=1 Tax=Methylotuvimicrobium alcaliphilum (strain DSM 19304 / NCIMB 14124 / VKM B-2133 / 20Z) TaxID=1091494 RepID=G4SZL9_META2|nr:ATP-binding protein [Methylotuvimicrobium alcaliphilum]CCE24460.1 Integral membrane sensor signal transduction histidine kinase [Methylotuvimicrobium alcaliphilum 20Z]